MEWRKEGKNMTFHLEGLLLKCLALEVSSWDRVHYITGVVCCVISRVK